MTLQAKLIALIVVLLIGFGSGFGVRNYIANTDELEAQVTDLAQDKEELAQYLTKVEVRDAKILLLQTRLHTLNTNSFKVLNEKLTENDRLRADLVVAQRMRLQGATCVKGPADAASAGASPVGDDATVVLSGETRQAVFDLRAAQLHDREKIDYLQHYIVELLAYLQRLGAPLPE